MFGKLTSSTRAEQIPLRLLGPNGLPADQATDASLWYQSDYLDHDEQQALWQELMAIECWQQETLMMMGRPVRVPRLTAYMGDVGSDYSYSGVRHRPHLWTGALAALRQRLCDQTGLGFNSVLLNQYRDGHDHMGWHSDNEPELGQQPIIASISLGAERRMRFRPRDRGCKIAGCSARSVHLDLVAGSLLIMSASVQSAWQHCLIRTARACGPRVNMTFRRVSVG